MAFQAENIEDLYQQLKSEGVRFNSPPLLVREGFKAAYFHDPDGITLEIVEYA
jgi:catechol 2,3-dioxygenase-like lactoylglutathione lyase family enzyme